MKFKSQLVTQASGSIGGATFSRNAGGMYIRARAVPVNPQTAKQTAVRNALTACMNRWTNVLTQVQRDAWNVYALNTPTTNVLGESLPKTGSNMYNRCNVARLNAGIAVIDAAPTVYDLGGFTAPVTTITASTDLMSIAFTNSDAWATAVGGYLLVFASAPQNPSINFFKGPYQYAGKISGAATPPTSPASMALPIPCAVGQAIFLKFNAIQVDGRYSAPLRFRSISV